MKFKVLSLLHGLNYDFVCENEQGEKENIDLYVDGGITFEDWPPDILIGRTIECSYTHPYLSIAHEVKVMEE